MFAPVSADLRPSTCDEVSRSRHAPPLCGSSGAIQSASHRAPDRPDLVSSADTQVLVIGGGQAGLAAGFYLRRLGLDFAILDAQPQSGGAWPHAWDSLALFSPAAYSSLPGKRMPPQPGLLYPDAAHVVEYLTDYEKHHSLPVQRLTRVHAVRRDASGLSAETNAGTWSARAMIGATGTWWRPFLPAIPGRELFRGRQLHTADYRNARDFAGEHVVVVGGGNSAAQIAADLALTGRTAVTWATRRPPRFLPDEVDGRALFDIATTRRRSSPGRTPPDMAMAALWAGDVENRCYGTFHPSTTGSPCS